MSGAALFHPPQLLLLTTAHTTRHSAYGGRKWKCGSTAPSVRRLRRKPKIATVPSPQAAARQVTTGTQLGSGALLNAGCERCTSAAATCAYRRSTLVRNPTGQGFSQAQCAARHRAVAVLQGTRRALQVPPLTAPRAGPGRPSQLASADGDALTFSARRHRHSLSHASARHKSKLLAEGAAARRRGTGDFDDAAAAWRVTMATRCGLVTRGCSQRRWRAPLGGGGC